MSSGTRIDPNAARNIQDAMSPEVMGRVARLGLSPRQQELNRLWAAYRGQQYASRTIDWDGSKRPTHLEREAISSGGYIPPGYYDAAGALLPLKYRRPSTPYHLRRVIVDRFTGLLFSDRRHPAFRVEDDPKTEDYVHTLGEVSRLWPTMIQVRTFGGAMGTVATGFQFVDGKPIIEVHDPRWCFPTFEDRHSLTLTRIEKRYLYPMDERDPETGAWVQVPYWYRRIIDDERDVLFKPCRVEEGDEPRWQVAREVVHGFGFCPVVWTQNLPVQDDIDGDPDCMGIEDTCDQIDSLLSQATLGVLANCDPTLRIISDAPMSEIGKGSQNAIKLPAGSSMDYMELSGSGPKAAVEQADRLRTLALEVAQCVLDHPESSGRTATEIERVYASMLAKADVLREQYGERCVKPLMAMMVKAIRHIEKPRAVASGGVVRQVVKLPEQVKRRDDGTIERASREIGEGAMLNLNWGPYFDPGLDDAAKAAQAAAAANQGGLLDQEHAVAFVAPFFNVEDAAGMLRKIKEEAAAAQASMDAQMMGGMGGEAAPAEEGAAFGEEEEAAPEEEAPVEEEPTTAEGEE